MADIDLPISGKDTSIMVQLAGIPQGVQDKVLRFEAKPVFDEITSKHIGKSGSDIDNEFAHWEGTIEFSISSGIVDDLLDTVTQARIDRVPVLINATENINYRNGVSRSYQYLDLKLQFDRKTVRGEANTISVPWKSGVNRKRIA